MGEELCLAHDMGGVEAYGGPLSVDMQPYGCFISFVSMVKKSKQGIGFASINFTDQNSPQNSTKPPNDHIAD